MRIAAGFIAVAALLASPALHGQELEPRAYTNLPVGLNFLVVAYANSEGGMATDPSLPLEDAHLKINTGVLAYARSLDLWGQSGKFDVSIPYSTLSGTALAEGMPAARNVDGFGDPRFRVSVNLFGAPSLPPEQFAAYRPDLVVGTSLQVTAPGRQYDPSKLINLGTNRWSVKPDIGLSKAFGPLTLDFTAGVTFQSKNNDYFGGNTLQQAPVYSFQSNVSYSFGQGIWAALGFTFYNGGRSTVNGAQKSAELENSRTGLTVAIPIDRRDSIKLNASTGISTRTGTSFNTLGVAWQYRWGAGL